MKKRNGLSTGYLLLASSLFFLSASAIAQVHVTGMAITKTCPVYAVAGSAFQCTFTIQNQDVDHGIINLSVTNTVPDPGGTTSAVSCLQEGVPVTTLGPIGSATDTCAGSASETAPACGSTETMLVDRIRASGFDEGIPALPVNGEAAAAVLILACTPTPTPAPPTNTPTPTVTPTPTHGPPPLPTQVPPHAGRPTPKPTKTPKP